MVFGKSFPYRCYKNPDPKKNVTLLVLAGGSGPADGFFYLYDDLMTDPDVVWDLKCGHLAMMTSLDEYLRTLHAFLRARNENYQ